MNAQPLTFRTTTLLGLCVLAVVAAGCSDSPLSPTSSSPASLSPATTGQVASTRPVAPGPTLGVPDREYFEVCKTYPSGTGPDVTVDVAVDIGNDGSIDQTFSTILSSGECEDVWLHGGAIYDKVTVTETVPTGYDASFVRSTLVVPSGTTTDPAVQGNVASGMVKGDTGVLVVFTNAPTPPGGQGCTPGYWRQSKSIVNWPAPYLPTTPFGSVFADAFPGKTLREVVALGGGGVNALGRHAVAALLNAASGQVTYGLSVADVIAGFNAAYASGDYVTFKDQLELLNEAGCPLN